MNGAKGRQFCIFEIL